MWISWRFLSLVKLTENVMYFNVIFSNSHYNLWYDNLPFWAKPFPHSLQKKCLVPVCISWCCFSSNLYGKDFRQISHLYVLVEWFRLENLVKFTENVMHFSVLFNNIYYSSDLFWRLQCTAQLYIFNEWCLLDIQLLRMKLSSKYVILVDREAIVWINRSA